MNQGAVRSSPVQQIVPAGSPNWWNTRPPPHHPNHSFLATPLQNNNLYHQDELTQPLLVSSSWNEYSHAMPESLSQLLMGGLVSDEEKGNMIIMNQMQQGKKLEHWEHNFLNQTSNEFQQAPKPNWSQFHQIITDPNSPNTSSVNTSLSSNMLEFSHRFSAGIDKQDRSSHECNSTTTGGPVAKKAKIQPSSAQSTFKVRKEKLGDRITALHQLVSPFGKTDTASVLLEAIGYIRFLQSQVEALSLPYLATGSTNTTHHQQVQGERNCLFPDDPGQECEEEGKKDLRSRGLCLVPISCTLHVGNDNGADYWAPAFGGNF